MRRATRLSVWGTVTWGVVTVLLALPVHAEPVKAGPVARLCPTQAAKLATAPSAATTNVRRALDVALPKKQQVETRLTQIAGTLSRYRVRPGPTAIGISGGMRF